MTNQPGSDDLTLDDLRAYQAGLLQGAERHRVERLLLEQPYYADALDGLTALQQSGTSLTAQTSTLRAALQKRIRQSASKQELWPVWLATSIAAILMVLAIAIYLIFFTKPQPTPASPPAAQPAAPLTPVRP